MPGESVRIIPVKDVVEPRWKIEGKGQVFPGMLSDVETVGEGKTLVLSGAAVVTDGFDEIRGSARHLRFHRECGRSGETKLPK